MFERNSWAGIVLGVMVVVGLGGTPSAAQVPPPPDADDILSHAYPGKSYSPYAGVGFPRRVYWGDTHLHTVASLDAGAFGNRLDLREAYRFARGEEVIATTGIPIRLSRPYDWLVVSDHSDNMGWFPDLLAGKPNLLADPTGRDWYDRIQAGDGVNVALDIISLFSQGDSPLASRAENEAMKINYR